jgi:hypothetical protein
MNVTLSPSRVVPAEWRGRARQFRDRISVGDEPARKLVVELSRRITARIKLRHHVIPRADTLIGVADAWRRQMPQHARLALQVDLNARRKTLRIEEMRLSASQYQDQSWGSSEVGVMVLMVRLETGPRLYTLATTTLCHVSLHGLARRLQRGLDGTDAAVLHDLKLLGEAHPGIADAENGSDVTVPVPGGSWRGNVALMNNPRGSCDTGLVVRTYLADGA